MRAEVHMKKIEEQMKKVNGKPYLRTKIALRVIVWRPFCDFLKKNLIPALVKVTIGQKRKRKDMREKVENRVWWQRCISIDVNFPKEKVHLFFGRHRCSSSFEMGGKTKRFNCDSDF